MSVLCTHKMYKRTLLYIVISGLLFRRHPNANTTFTMGCHLQGQDEDQSLHHHQHHASTCWQQSLAPRQVLPTILLEPSPCVHHTYIYRRNETQYIYIYTYIHIIHGQLLLLCKQEAGPSLSIPCSCPCYMYTHISITRKRERHPMH